MIKRVNFSDFVATFNMFSEGYLDKFTNAGKRALFDYLESVEEETGEDIELDVIALCCDYTEYADFKEFSENYASCTTIDDIENHTTIIKIPDTTRFIIQNF